MKVQGLLLLLLLLLLLFLLLSFWLYRRQFCWFPVASFDSKLGFENCGGTHGAGNLPSRSNIRLLPASPLADAKTFLFSKNPKSLKHNQNISHIWSDSCTVTLFLTAHLSPKDQHKKSQLYRRPAWCVAGLLHRIHLKLVEGTSRWSVDICHLCNDDELTIDIKIPLMYIPIPYWCTENWYQNWRTCWVQSRKFRSSLVQLTARLILRSWRRCGRHCKANCVATPSVIERSVYKSWMLQCCCALQLLHRISYSHWVLQ